MPFQFDPTQLQQLQKFYESSESGEYPDCLNATLSKAIALIQDSPNARIVEAPEGYEFSEIEVDTNWVASFGLIQFGYHLKPIPKPCPAPVLAPITVDWESVYECKPVIPDGFEAVFGLVKDLKRAGFTKYLGDRLGMVADIKALDDSVHRICLRKWEGK